tara:strand:- start:70 stop:753 length:684 start_codon:yes stop_codon:yes gene_type:complete
MVLSSDININEIHKLCFLDRKELFTSFQLQKFSDRRTFDNDPFIGYFGKKYESQKVRVMFLGRSNAESSKSHKILDTNINNAFKVFQKSKLKKDYRNYADKYVEAMPHWKIYQNFVKYFLDKTNLDIDQISYANAVPFRYKGKPLVSVFEIAYNTFTENLINLYKPHLIVPLGTGDEMLIKRFCNKKTIEDIVISDGIRRTNGDNYRDQIGEKMLNEAISQYNKFNE